MAQPVLPSPSNFLAVALVIKRSRDGPEFVFHYPPRVQPPRGHQSLNESGENDDVLLERLNEPAESLDDPVDSSAANNYSSSNWDEHHLAENGTQRVPWEHVAGFPTKDLASILTPARSYHKKLFQLSLDPLYCVSYPIHVPESGSWKKKKKKDKPKKAKSAKTDDTAIGPLDPEPPKTVTETSTDADGPMAESKEKEKEEDDDKRASMTMFNLVFILHPKKHEVKELVSTLYFNIIKKVNKAYKYSQQHSDFVWKESKRIIAMKDKAREESKSMAVSPVL